MIDEILNSYDETLELVRWVVHDLGPHDLTAQPPGVPNHPAWTLGHLVYSAEAIGDELGLDPWLPDDWKARFGTGSSPEPTSAAYPPVAELLERLEDARQRIHTGLGGLEPEALEGPLPDERYRSVFPTLGHAVIHILSAHTAFHSGQLMVWRRAMGLPTQPAL